VPSRSTVSTAAGSGEPTAGDGPVFRDGLYRLGRLAEAEASAGKGLEVGAKDDIPTQVISRCVIGRVRAREGRYDDAERLLREATALAKMTDSVVMTADALLDRGRCSNSPANTTRPQSTP
jgi:ATP/maltotriose-dependent transcriptional regulator MalT